MMERTPSHCLVEALTGFALSLYQQLGSQDPHKNLFFSPSSASVGLAMTYLGANGTTASEMRKVLHFEGVSDEELHCTFMEMLQTFEKQDRLTLHTARRLFVDKDFDIDEEYVTRTQKFYGTDLGRVDFQHCKKASDIINRWVEAQTAKRIQNIISSDVLNSMTKLVLVNAIYFKGDWKLKFDPLKTEPAEFKAADGTTVQVQMMFQKAKFTYGVNQALHTQALELKYAGDSMSLIILLPEDGKYRHFEDNVKLEHLASVQKSFSMTQTRSVNVWLPRLRMEESFSLADTLSAMGMKDLFSQDNADLSGICPSQHLYVSDVIHKAFLEVNEEGSEAAAATAVRARAKKRSSHLVHFCANKPFMFFIRENTTNAMLFLGRLMKPRETH